MHGVSKATSTGNIMLVSISDVKPAVMAETLHILASEDVVVDMISQTPPAGQKIRFSFTASFDYFDKTIKALGAKKQDKSTLPMISGGYSKINLFGEEMVDSVGVAARALKALQEADIEVAMITTSDLDISILVRCEDEDITLELMNKTYSL